ncbi:MAG: hypothetical protein GAK45_01523 [Pseudomonas citronellolis]|nr:MAG: hypothetical protein GAK45_01523 [Pseudomonas citronellolis]
MARSYPSPQPISSQRLDPRAAPLGTQQRLRRIERGGFWALLVLVALILAGVTGGSPLSPASARNVEGTLRVDYQRFVRDGTFGRLDLRLQGTPGQRLSIQLNRQWLESFSVEGSLPPVRFTAAGADGGLRFEGLADAHGQLNMRLYLHVQGAGLARGKLEVNGRELRWWQLIYP